MFLGSYRFDGDPAALVPAYERLMAGFSDADEVLHVCVVRGDGITVYDACPTRQVFEQFAASPEFAGALAGAGLPAPDVEPCGDVHATRVRT